MQAIKNDVSSRRKAGKQMAGSSSEPYPGEHGRAHGGGGLDPCTKTGEGWLGEQMPGPLREGKS